MKPTADAFLIDRALERAMTQEHPNVALMTQLDPSNLAASKEMFADDVVWHYFNPNMPDMQGDYVGLDGIQSFFETIGQRSRGTFKVQPVSVTPAGDELVVVQARNTLTLEDQAVALDVVVVWRIVDGRVVEVWDIVPGRPAGRSR